MAMEANEKPLTVKELLFNPGSKALAPFTPPTPQMDP